MSIAADWTDPAHYAALADIGAPGLAWEWLRRDPGYRAAWDVRSVAHGHAGRSDCRGESAAFGLVAFEDPAHDALEALPLWSRGIDPSVLVADAVPLTRDGDAFDLARWSWCARLLSCACGAEHLMLHAGGQEVRIDVLMCTLRAGPVCLRYRVEGIASAAPQLLALRRLLSLVGHGAFAPALFPPPVRMVRRLLELRVHDALAAGADHQTIARALFGGCIADGRWRIESSSYRYRVQRLAIAARAMAAGGWRAILAR